MSGYYDGIQNPPDMPAMTREEENRLFTRYKRRKCPKAKEALVRRYLCVAFKIASKLRGPRLSHEEAIGAANLGLMEAFEKYNLKKGRFSTHAYFIIRRHVIQALLNTYPVTLTDHYRKKIKTFGKLDGPPLAGPFLGRNEGQGRSDEHRLEDEHEVLQTEDDRAAVETSTMAEDVKKFVLSSALSPLERLVLVGRHYRDPAESFHVLTRRLHRPQVKIKTAYDSALLKLKLHFNPPNES